MTMVTSQISSEPDFVHFHGFSKKSQIEKINTKQHTNKKTSRSEERPLPHLLLKGELKDKWAEAF